MNKNINQLDESLEATENLRGLVHGLPDDQVSLQWRSELNEKILAMAAKPRRSWLSLAWRPVSALAVAGAVAFVFMSKSPSPTPSATVASNSEFTNEIFNAHETSIAYREIGVTMPHSQSQPLLNLVDRSEEVDLGAL